jgi:hypothetical protein
MAASRSARSPLARAILDFKTISRVLLSAIDGLLIQNLLGEGELPLREISRFFAYYKGELTRPVSEYSATN